MEETKETQESLQRKREQALQRLRKERTEEALWDCVTAYQDFEFHTYSGLPYSYHMKYGRSGTYTKELWINRREKSNGIFSGWPCDGSGGNAYPCADGRRNHFGRTYRLFDGRGHDRAGRVDSGRGGTAGHGSVPVSFSHTVYRGRGILLL